MPVQANRVAKIEALVLEVLGRTLQPQLLQNPPTLVMSEEDVPFGKVGARHSKNYECFSWFIPLSSKETAI